MLVLGVAVASMIASSAQATRYKVYRSFTTNDLTAELTGTLDIPIGHYVLEHNSPSPFTDLNLTVNMNGTPFPLVYAITGGVTSNTQFIVEATSTALTFSTANEIPGMNTYLAFTDKTLYFLPNRYIIGSYFGTDMELAQTTIDDGVQQAEANLTFPVIFGTAIPEPSTALLLCIGALGIATLRRRDGAA